jgi:hypothetical protein
MTFQRIVANFIQEDSMRLEHKIKLFFRVLTTWRYEKQMQLFFESLQIEDILTKHPRYVAEEVKSKKRSMYKKRYALLHAMQTSIDSSIQAYKR